MHVFNKIKFYFKICYLLIYSSDEDEDHVHGQKTKKPLTSLKKPSAKVGNDTKKKDPKPKTKKTSKRLLPPLRYIFWLEPNYLGGSELFKKIDMF